MKLTWKEVSNYLHYNWWKIFGLSIVIIVIWTIFINEITSPNENEQISIVAINSSIDVDNLRKDAFDYMQTYQSQNIEEVHVNNIDVVGQEFHDFLVTRSLPGTDIIILPGSSVLENTASNFFLALDEDKIRGLFGTDVSYYYEDGILYGIGLQKDTSETRFSTYLGEDDQEYFVFINHYSVNVGDWNEQSDATDQAVIELISWFLE